MEHDQKLKSTGPRGKGDRYLRAGGGSEFLEMKRDRIKRAALFLALLGVVSSCAAPATKSAQPSSRGDHSPAVEPAQNNEGRLVPSPETKETPGAPQKQTDPWAPHAAYPAPQAKAVLWESTHAQRGRSCADLQCYSFMSEDGALRELVSLYDPAIIAFGEAHAPTSYAKKSTVARFTESLLPSIASRAHFLLVELLAPPQSGCEPARAQAERESAAITSGQRAENQNEYVQLGHKARQLGVLPDILRATCDDLRSIAAVDGGVLVYMETIRRLALHELSVRWDQTNTERPLVLSYGGALHNDAAPRKERASWSFGPALLDKTQGRYLEVDLILPALITDSETWRAFPWYQAYQAAAHKPGETLLIPWGEHSVAFIFSPEPGAT